MSRRTRLALPIGNMENSMPFALSDEETKVLNRHGVFFKKRVLEEISRLPDLGIFAEEYGVTFGQTRVADIVVEDRAGVNLVFVIECKRFAADSGRWIFFRDIHQRYRICRGFDSYNGHYSKFANSKALSPPVCSEGYEFRKRISTDQNNKSADQDPIFQAAAQLSQAYLGLINLRHRTLKKSGEVPFDFSERYVPVLVTNAELFVVESDLSATSLETGVVPKSPAGIAPEFIILKQPFPTPAGIESDFREHLDQAHGALDWAQIQKESIYVVRASGLREFFEEAHRRFLRRAETEQ
jgi:hypothetical protein